MTSRYFFISNNFSLRKLLNIIYFFIFKLKWSEPDEEGLVKFLCGDKQFNEERIRNGSKKLHKARNTSTQGRLDSFFKVLPNTTATPKRKVKYFSNTKLLISFYISEFKSNKIFILYIILGGRKEATN